MAYSAAKLSKMAERSARKHGVNSVELKYVIHVNEDTGVQMDIRVSNGIAKLRNQESEQL